ncbi:MULTISPECIES: low-specificity L-threonine aldolase [unclassified Salinivibrio]|uniref:low-specificity L-threonine aldolase n=1 Tax=unclassified Salinivibrio TaxID=2636825 RepID=UPI00128D4ACD|nr:MULTISPECIES: low-specificity L-threonine aldolase [unclassified Salinivibrio]MPS31327.1 low-specificity L-threonine aldolase [Salinivibrio sp. VYel7]MPX91460.1 low-specificity L-threonine aldolase [Salinivibrio sp. VYel1]MPX92726.1 low-specificity L-threonine aldolase [Salinivibrio sp. VYel9]MPX95590.1 low-specificity L-threonine aldolase [Salinivibrio sp. VYel6]MPX98944.1 low-specificity L-threonine aldolase [Salinivibrio sp. VYel4]
MIDFRSDTVTQPDAAMRDAMANAPVGDDVYGDDPSINALETWAAERHGFEAALFTASGTQANLLALMAHCERGDEYLCGQQAHNYKYEAGGAAVLGSIQPQPIENESDGTLSFDKIATAIKPDDFHFARTKLLSLENTIGGKVLPLSYLAKARTFCDQHQLQLHLDGARVYNAAVALEVDIKAISCHFDSMTICLSKGLGAPVGSLLLGSKALIHKARRLRKMLGGGMRQAGILAVAGYKALTENVERLTEDHANAHYLASELEKLNGFSTSDYPVQTNIVYVDVAETINRTRLQMRLMEKEIRVSLSGNPARLVTHKDICRADIDTLIAAIKGSH